MSLNGWLREIKRQAGLILKKAQLQPKLAELYQAAEAELGILPDKPRTSYERYQTTLDNQLYRAIRELWQLQERRLKTIETVPAIVPDDASAN